MIRGVDCDLTDRPGRRRGWTTPRRAGRAGHQPRAGGAIPRRRGAAGRALQHGDDPAIEPGQLMVRVFIPAPTTGGLRAGPGRVAGRPPGAGWRAPAGAFAAAARGQAARVHLRAPPRRPADQRAGRRLAGRRAAVRPRDRDHGAGAAARELRVPRARRAGRRPRSRRGWRPGEYDDLDEVTLTELLTSHLQEISGDKHLRRAARRGPGPAARPGPVGPRAGGTGRTGPDRTADEPRVRRLADAPDRAAGQLRHPPGRAPGRQHRLPRPAPDAGAGERGAGHRRGDGAGRRDLRAHHRPAAQRRRLAGGRGVLVQLPARRAAHAPQRHLPRRHRRDQAVLVATATCRAPATSTARSTC